MDEYFLKCVFLMCYMKCFLRKWFYGYMCVESIVYFFFWGYRMFIKGLSNFVVVYLNLLNVYFFKYILLRNFILDCF